MITGGLRRSSLPSRQTLSAALTSFDSSLFDHFSSAATVASVDCNLVGNGSTLSSNLISRFKAEPSMILPANKKKESTTSKIKGTRICIAIRSFDNPEKQAWCLPPHARYAAMPDTRTLYTSHELSNKLFWLKRYRILGAQYELQFHCKTRLDMAPVLGNISGST
ncbi:40S ribosomal protein S10 [Raphanus sativus]|nr:40S ribosomal protein S10 [Raphanus sativus]